MREKEPVSPEPNEEKEELGEPFAQGGPACLNYIGKKKHTWGVEREKRLSRFLMLKP